ncbi:MAG: Tol-Pal system beta propeller repeat protein TolB [Rhodobacteraceae bacterium]|nr:Tol-Pal system beta propeller repeat protein TolB [Paracoccaceae bacterium]
MAGLVQAQDRPTIEIDISGGVIEPIPVAVPPFIAETNGAQRLAGDIASVIMADLASTGLFREIPGTAFIGAVTNFNAQPVFSDWSVVNAQALVTGAVSTGADGRLVVKFRLFDVFAQTPIGDGVQYAGTQENWRRMAHKVADTIYSRITGESGYFDSRIVFIAESGPKNDRRKRIAAMDYDGANLRYLTDDSAIVLAPRFAPNNRDIIYTSYESGLPQVFLLNMDTGRRSQLLDNATNMATAPRFSPDGTKVVMSIIEGSNTDIYQVDLNSRSRIRLTNSGGIDTTPSYSPDGSQIVFASDRGGSQQLYVMSANGGAAQRISSGGGSYGTPVWSPRGDMIAFTKMRSGRFHIGVMRVDGSRENLLTASFIDEAPTWSPNGRVLMFFRETAGANGAPQIYSVDLTGRNLRRIDTPSFASDPDWSGVLR